MIFAIKLFRVYFHSLTETRTCAILIKDHIFVKPKIDVRIIKKNIDSWLIIVKKIMVNCHILSYFSTNIYFGIKYQYIISLKKKIICDSKKKNDNKIHK